MSNLVTKPNHNDPCITQEQLVHVVVHTNLNINQRILACLEAKHLTFVDLLYLDEQLRFLHCAVTGLQHSVTHDKPIKL